MSDITTVWDVSRGNGDWVVVPSALVSETFPVEKQPFGRPDGVQTSFRLVDSQGRPLQAATVQHMHQTDWQGRQELYPTPRTNLILGSSTIGGSGWTLVGRATVGSTDMAPDGTNTANLLVGVAGFTGYAQSASAFAVTANTSYAGSIFLKAGTATSNAIVIFNAGVTTTVGTVVIGWANNIPAITSTAGAITGAALTACSQPGWYKLSYTINTGSNVSIRELVYVDRNNTGSSVYAWGSSLGDPGSFIPTTTSAVTLTDYVVDPSGLVALGQVPPSGSILDWSGSSTRSYVTQGGFLQSGDDLSTSALISLFTDRTAEPSDRLPDATTDRRGWWGDVDQDVPIGSRLWLLGRSKLTPAVAAAARGYASEALAWMLTDGIAVDIQTGATIVKPSTLRLTASITRSNGTKESYGYDWAWAQLAA
jgi:phage gp46-like protein